MSGTTLPLRAVPTRRYNGTIGAIFSLIRSKKHKNYEFVARMIFLFALLCVIVTAVTVMGITIKLIDMRFFDSEQEFENIGVR